MPKATRESSPSSTHDLCSDASCICCVSIFPPFFIEFIAMQARTPPQCHHTLRRQSDARLRFGFAWSMGYLPGASAYAQNTCSSSEALAQHKYSSSEAVAQNSCLSTREINLGKGLDFNFVFPPGT
jgi:hypothetical protein